MHRFLTVTLTAFFLISSIVQAAEPVTTQPQRPPMPQKHGSIPQLQLTPDYLNQQIIALKQQVLALNQQIIALKQQVSPLQAQVNVLRSVVQITQNGTTIQAPTLTINASQGLAITSNKDVRITAGADIDLESGNTLSLKSSQVLSSEAGTIIRLKSPLIKLNNGTKPLGIVGSQVSGGKVITGSSTIFAK